MMRTTDIDPFPQANDYEVGTALGESIRPSSLSDFIGQDGLKENLSTFIKAAKNRKEPLDHVILYGPPGLGKTTLAYVIAKEMGVNIKTSSGPVLSKPGDLAAILTNLEAGDVLFIDEIHRLSRTLEELLYSVMEDFHMDLVIGDGPAARSLRMNLARFTLIGATTKLGLLTNPFKDRFGIPLKLSFYQDKDLHKIVLRAAKKLNLTILPEAAVELASRSRGTPRIAIRLLRRVRDFAADADIAVDREFVVDVLRKLSVDEYGLDSLDMLYLRYIMHSHKGGPVGIETIAAGISEDVRTIEDFIEPYLMRLGFVDRSSRGRILTEKCKTYLTTCSLE